MIEHIREMNPEQKIIVITAISIQQIMGLLHPEAVEDGDIEFF